ncbi:E3 ubiquitin-protein ligase TRIM47 [Erpetoichthys calabaricus]|uniref:Tripartite motif containing 47 n=1 Tax=Erpetoichthys calabaricus TaxID=27687 RepID=A0A8C4S0A0_ERPCA|nr:E3 ubiquitin-protein ligase TRIM47 [Erpetoichthys calabaricus]
MATASSDYTEALEKELICPICLDFFEDPVILQCGHNFCRYCILLHWEENGSDYSGYQCPECRRTFPEITFTRNFLVKNLVNKLDDLNVFRTKDTKPVQPPKEDLCEKHHEELKLYCRKDGKPICVICRESRAHRRHEVVPVSEFIDDLKAELQIKLSKLTSDRDACNRAKKNDMETSQCIKTKKSALKHRIELEVGDLVQFLLDEKDELLAKLDAEEADALFRVENNLAQLERAINSLEKEIDDIQSHLKESKSVKALMEISSRPYEKPSNTRPTENSAHWEEFSGPVQMIFWKRMMSVLKPGPENVELDFCTAHPNVVISDFGTKMEESRGRVLEPEIPEQYTRFLGVLATKEYTSGRHYWEVDVKCKSVWYLGVTEVSSNRKGYVSLTPNDGYWSICLQDQLYANEEHRVPIPYEGDIARVGIYLDYNAGIVSFYNATFMKHLYTFTTEFVCPVIPFFSPGKNDFCGRIKICHYD